MKLLCRPITVGIDIGSALVKAAVIDHSSGEPRLTQLAAVPNASSAIVDGEIVSRPGVVSALKALVRLLDIRRAGTVVTAVGGRDVIVRTIRMGRMRDIDLEAAVALEAERAIPFDIDGISLDFRILAAGPDGTEMDVLLAAARQGLVGERMEILKEAEIPVNVVDVEAIALSNALQFNYPGVVKGNVTLANVGNDTTTVVVHARGLLALSRDLPFGCRAIDDSSGSAGGHPRDENGSVPAIGAQAAGRPGCSVFPRADDLADAIGRVSAGEGRSGGSAAIYLTGGGASVPGLAETIARRLKMRTEILNPFERIEVAPEALVTLEGDSVGPLWMLPVGLALRNSN